MPVMVHIGTPGDREEVSGGGSFETSGTVSPPGALMSARVRDAAAKEIQGELQPARSGYDWTFRFPSVSTDEPLTLVVRGMDPQTLEIAEAMRTIRFAFEQSSLEDTFSAPGEQPTWSHAAETVATPPFEAAPHPATDETAPLADEAPLAEPAAPVALPPITVNPALAATGDLPPAATFREPAPRKRARPAPRKKARTPARKAARVPAGRRPKSAPAKAARTPAARRNRAPAKKSAPVVAKKPTKKPIAKASKTGPKKVVKAAVKSARPAPKKSVKAKTAKAAASAARRGTKPTPRKTNKATAKTNPKKRQAR